jgi:hypothetical protein
MEKPAMALATSQCTFCIALWNEETTREFPNGSKFTRADVSQTYDGDMAGSGTAEYLMAYTPDGPVKFVGLEVLSGSIGGRRGTVLIQHDGVFAHGVAHSNWHFVEGSGTGELISLHGTGSYESVDAQTVNSSFIYTFGEG